MTIKEVEIPLSITYINSGAFYKTSVEDVYYAGTDLQWGTIDGRSSLSNATIHYKSKIEPTVTTTTTTAATTTTTKATTTTKPTTVTTTKATTSATTTTENPYATPDSPMNGFTQEEIDASEIKPHIYVESKLLTLDEAKNEQTISIIVKGADKKIVEVGLHIFFDKRLSIKKNYKGKPIVEEPVSATAENPYAEGCGKKGIYLTTISCDIHDGVMWTITFKLPEDAKAGDVYPIDIIYYDKPNARGFFTNQRNDTTGKLMQAYTFTRGIKNGFASFFNPETDAVDADCNVIEGIVEACPAVADVDKSIDAVIAIAGDSILYGDANCDGEVNIADATAIIQAIGNKDKYALSEQGEKNADCYHTGDGVTGMDAMVIQQVEASIYKLSDLPIKE